MITNRRKAEAKDHEKIAGCFLVGTVFWWKSYNFLGCFLCVKKRLVFFRVLSAHVANLHRFLAQHSIE